MNNKDKYINIIYNRFSGKAKEILLNQVELFYHDINNTFKS